MLRARVLSCGAQPRIEDLVEQVAEQVDADEDRAHQHRAAEHRVHVAVEQRAGDVEAEPRPGEDGFGQHRAFEQRGIAEADDRDQRHHDVGEGMQPHRAPERTALDARRGHIFLAQLVDHEAARHAGDIGQRDNSRGCRPAG